MECPKCQSENREGVKFCEECGAKMEFKCPSCSALIPMGKKFCGECGHSLTTPSEPVTKELSFDEKIDKIQRYLPEGLTEKILAQRDRIEGERKQVTVMFCDMAGFTSLSERLGPEEAYDIVDQVYELLIHKVHDYEGTVNELTGDGILALFGAPIALEDAPQRAIRSGLAIHREMAKLSDKMKKERGGLPTLKMRIGIHTGPVVVGTVGNNLRVDFKAVGDTVNLASRMEGLAEPGATHVTEATFKLTEGFFRFEALGEKEVKGKKEPVKVYRVIAPSTRRTRFDVSAERGLTPFVGRDREFDLLMDGFERAKGGRGQAFSIIAEAGLGKSRLLYEFRKAVANEDIMFLEGKCLSYSRGVAYHLLIDSLKANFDIVESDRDSEIREKVIKGLQILKVDEASTLPYFLELLSVKDSGIDQIPISPEAKKERIMEAFRQVVLKGSEIRPLILAYEDLHWMDKSSEDVLKYVLESIPAARILMIFNYRPEFVHTWGAKTFHSQISLNRLSNRESLAMVSHLLGTEEIDSNLEELILEKAEGVPLFIEEFIKSLKDLKIIEQKGKRYRLAKDVEKVTIPSTVQDVIMARVDSLPDLAKEVLQTGSVIEREFGYELIKYVTRLPEQELLSRLSILKDSELFYERGIYPQSAYVFKHALTQDVVYDSILAKVKKKLHEEIGNAIESLYKDTLDGQYGILAEHFISGENYEKGAKYAKLACKKAQKAASFKEAIAYAEKEILCLEKLPATEDIQKKLIDARTRLAGYHFSLTHHVEANEAVAPIADLAANLNYQKRLPLIYIAMGTYKDWVEEDYSEGFRYLSMALKISEETKDTLGLWYANWWLGMNLSWNCEFEKGIEFFERSLELGKSAKSLIPLVMAKTGMVFFNYADSGKNDLAYQTSKESVKLAEESGDTYIKGIAFSSHGAACYYKGSFDEAEESLLRAFSFCEKASQLGWLICAVGFLGHLYSDLGEVEKAHVYYEKGISNLERTQIYPFFLNMWQVSLARSKVQNKDQDLRFDELFGYYEKVNLKVAKGWTARHVAEILLNTDELHLSEAEDWINKAIEADETNRTRWSLACDYAVYAELFKQKGNPSDAKENLAKAIDIFNECGADGWVKKYKEELASLS
jgi:class 3 adenylate cyclase/tetratricopeptide (TPR) repeat protein